ncbi:MAG: zinc ribbon domain-containing protein [Bacilli bacterium]|nr:zinc ribbon domain-containing protein [Bacilli bacterium]
MKCPKCGKEVDVVNTVCPECGAELPSLERVAITRRRGPGIGQWVTVIFGLCFSALLITLAFIAIARHNDQPIGIGLLLFFGFAILGLQVFPVICIVANFIRVKPCIEFVPGDRSFIFHPLFAKPFSIKPREFIWIRRYPLTCFVLVVRFQRDGKTYQAFLGWTDDVVPFQIRVNELR